MIHFTELKFRSRRDDGIAVKSVIQVVKSKLVALGPEHRVVQLALWTQGKLRGLEVHFDGAGRIVIRRSAQAVVLRSDRYAQVPIIMDTFDLYFKTIRPAMRDGVAVLDFSQPALHYYFSCEAELEFANIPEDESMDAYLHCHTPEPGDTVWDVGAHSGLSVYFLSKLVGPRGRVFAFEPDEFNYEYLERNLQRHGLLNVVPIRKALSDETGHAEFNMDGTMSAGIHDRLIYSGNGELKQVETLSIADACASFGSVPSYIKMDIEGSEVAAIAGSSEFLRSHPIHFAVEGHRTTGEHTCLTMGRLFAKLGYQVETSNGPGTRFTWASPFRA